MKGNNTLELNEATMIEAVQYWLECQFAEGKAPIVKSVTGGSGMTKTFEGKLENRSAQ